MPQSLKLSEHIGVWSTLDYSDGNTFAQALMATMTACATAGGGVVKLPSSVTPYVVTEDSAIQIPANVELDMNSQTIQWSSNTADTSVYCIRSYPGSRLRNGTLEGTGTGTGALHVCLSETATNGAGTNVFLRNVETVVEKMVIEGTTSRTYTGQILLATGNENYIQWVRVDQVDFNNLSRPFILEAKDGTSVCFVNGNSYTNIGIDKCVGGPLLTTNMTGSDVNNNHFQDIRIQAGPFMTNAMAFVRASSNQFHLLQVFDWDETGAGENGAPIGITFDTGAINNRVHPRCSAANPATFFGGDSAERNDTSRAALQPEGGLGTISVRSAVGEAKWHCRADGSGFDDRDTILEAMTYAAANMPARVHFGKGDYGISGGMILEPVQGSRGLHITSNKNAYFTFTGDNELIGGEEILFKIRPSVTPTTGDYANYLHDITVEGLNCDDDNPSVHGGGSAPDQSHFVDIQYCVNATVRDCRIENIGDEAVNFFHVIGGTIERVFTQNTPSFGANGSPLSIQQGCKDIVIKDGWLYGTEPRGAQSALTLSSGVAITSLDATGTENVTVKNMTIEGFSRAGVFINPSAGNLTRIKVDDCTMINCDWGIDRAGASFDLTYLSVKNNQFKDMDSGGYNSPVAGVATDHTYTGNEFINCPAIGAMNTAVRLSHVGNKAENCGSGVIVVNATNCQMSGNQHDNCGGGAGFEEFRCTNGTGNSANGNKITNSACTNGIIRGIQEVTDNYIERTSVSAANAGFGLEDCKNARGNTLVNAGIRPLGGGCQISGNHITCSFTGGTSSGRFAIDIASDNTNCSIINNYADMTGCTNNQIALRTNAASSGCLIDGNILLSATDSFADNAGSTLGTNITV